MSGPELAHALIEMVAHLHTRGFESLAILPLMAPSGMSWRYALGALPASGVWGPSRFEPTYTRGSLGPAALEWCSLPALPTELGDAFVAAFDPVAARTPNPAYAEWLRGVLASLPPGGAFIMAAEYNDFDRIVSMGAGSPVDSQLPMPPGFRR